MTSLLFIWLLNWENHGYKAETGSSTDLLWVSAYTFYLSNSLHDNWWKRYLTPMDRFSLGKIKCQQQLGADMTIFLREVHLPCWLAMIPCSYDLKSNSGRQISHFLLFVDPIFYMADKIVYAHMT